MESAMPPTSDPSSPPDSDLRLARVLGELKAKEGGYSALARAIDRSTAAGPRPDSGEDDRKRGFDRRKLKSIIEADKNLVLSLKELRALDCYLERYGEGLAYVPLFQKPDLMQTLAESGRVTFLLGSKPEAKGELRHFSHWDVLAMAEIQRAINPSEVSVRFDIQDVPLYEELEATRESITGTGGWMELLDDHGPSLVCLGSSRTNPAEEAMLCEMFQRPAFEEAPPDERRQLPFHFVWNPDLPYVFPSHFHLRSDDISSDHPDAAELIEGGQCSAVVTDDAILVDRVTPRRSGDTYGVCVAQRRKRGQVWLALAGVTGAATFVAAKLAKSLATRLHEQKRGQDSDVYWAAIRGRVPKDRDRPFVNLRQFAQETIVSALQVWKRETR
jgi:hypothetical protein